MVVKPKASRQRTPTMACKRKASVPLMNNSMKKMTAISYDKDAMKMFELMQINWQKVNAEMPINFDGIKIDDTD